jgi:transposase InsO family protein
VIILGCGRSRHLVTQAREHLKQIAAELHLHVLFSQPGVPRGRGKIERFFQTIEQLLLQRLPGNKYDEKETLGTRRPGLLSPNFSDAHWFRWARGLLYEFFLFVPCARTLPHR